MTPAVPGTTDTTGCTGILLSDLYLYSLQSWGYAVAVVSDQSTGRKQMHAKPLFEIQASGEDR